MGEDTKKQTFRAGKRAVEEFEKLVDEGYFESKSEAYRVALDYTLASLKPDYELSSASKAKLNSLDADDDLAETFADCVDHLEAQSPNQGYEEIVREFRNYLGFVQTVSDDEDVLERADEILTKGEDNDWWL